MPKHYPDNFTYQRAGQFSPSSVGDIGTYDLLGMDENITFLLRPADSVGFVFLTHELETGGFRDTVTPVMHVHLRESTVNGYKQAHKLRIRQSYSRLGVATRFYLHYVERYGGVVSDFEHLEGGKTLCQSLINKADQRGIRSGMVDTATVERHPADRGTRDELIWSFDDSRRKPVLVLEKA